MQYLGAISKTTERSLFVSKANHTIFIVIQVYAQPLTPKKLKLNGLWRPTRPSRTNTKNICPFYHRRLECKNRKSRDTWSNRQVWRWSTKWSRKNANRVCWENALVIANTLFQHQKQINTWTPDGQYWNQIDYILCSQRWRSSIQSAETRPGADCGSDHEHFIAKFRLKLKKVGKTTSSLWYDLNQIPYDYTMDVTNRFKGSDLIECLKNYRWRFITLYKRQWSKPSPREGNAKGQNGCLGRPYK